MNKMSLEKGRIKQKLMTRETILRSAKKLMGSRQNVTLEDVADEAEISRATVYRYFSNIDLLLAEASLDIHHLSPKEILDQIRSRPATERLTFTQKYYNGLALEHELIFRRYLSAVLAESTSSKKKEKRGPKKKDLE